MMDLYSKKGGLVYDWHAKQFRGNITLLYIMTMNTITPMEKIYNYKPQ